LAEVTAGPTREEIDAQRASVAVATAAVNQARLSPAVRITALSNTMQYRLEQHRRLVESNDPIVTLVNGRVRCISRIFSEELGGSIAPGLPVIVTRSHPLAAQAVHWVVLPGTCCFPTAEAGAVRLENPPQELLPGMAIQGELQLRTNFLVL